VFLYGEFLHGIQGQAFPPTSEKGLHLLIPEN